MAERVLIQDTVSGVTISGNTKNGNLSKTNIEYRAVLEPYVDDYSDLKVSLGNLDKLTITALDVDYPPDPDSTIYININDGSNYYEIGLHSWGSDIGVANPTGTPLLENGWELKFYVEESEEEKFLDKMGLTHAWNKLKTYFQDKLVSGTNIKTINNESLLGSGNITTFDDVFVATYNTTAFSELASAITGGKSIILKNINNSNLLFDMVVNMSSLGTSGINLKGIVYDQSTVYKVSVTVTTSNVWSNTFEEVLDVATDDDYGLVKLNSIESVTRNSDGQLIIGGRLGQFSSSTGIFHSKDREPRAVGDYTLLITDAKGMESAGPRNLTLLTGNNLPLNGSHAAGSTQYKVANNYANRILCAGIKYIALNESSAKQSQVVKVTSVTINGSSYTPNSDPSDSSKPIIITAEASVNPSSAVSQIRVFSAVGTGSYCSEYVGQCVGGDAGGDGLAMGQYVFNKSGNMNAMVGQSLFNTGNGNAIFGRQHISRKNRSFLAGTGHDTTNARSESVSALGEWSDLSSPETLFAIGNGTSHTDRSNAFEVLSDGIVLKSPNGIRFKITVDNSGNLVTTQL